MLATWARAVVGERESNEKKNNKRIINNNKQTKRERNQHQV